MKWLLIVAAALVGLGILIFLIGAALPQGHTATVRARLKQPARDVFAVLTDIQAAPGWREDLTSIEILSESGEPLRWRETEKFGVLTFVREEEIPDRRLVGRIADTSEGFGGRWVYELEPLDHSTVLTVTEHGEVFNPLFRFMARFVFGHYATLEGYVRALGRHFGEEVEVERLPAA
jgi:hypothetical protein